MQAPILKRDDQGREQHPALAGGEQRLVLLEGTGAGTGRPVDDDDVINLREYWEVILRRKSTVIYFFLFALIVTLIGTFLMTPIYRSTLVLQIERESAKIIEYQDVTPEEGDGARDFYQTQYELLQSRTLARRVIDELGLESAGSLRGEENTSVIGGLRKSVGDLLSGETEPATEPRGPDLETMFLRHLTVAPVRNSRLVHIHYDSPDPVLAARVVNAVAENFVSTTLERRFDASAYAKNFLQEQLKQVRANLEDSERKLAEYAKAREILDLDEKEGFLMQQIQDLNKELVEAESERIAAESEAAAMQSRGGSGHVRVLDDPVIHHLKESLAELEGEYQQNLNVYKPAYPKMVKLQSRIQELKRRIEGEVGNVKSAVDAKYNAAVTQEALLQAKMAELKREVLELRDKSTDFQTLKRDVDTNRKLYDGLLQRMKEVGVAAGIGSNNISIVDAGEVPAAPFKPSLSKNLLLAMVLGLFGGIGLAFLFEHLDDSIKSTQDLESKTGLSVLGVVPAVKKLDQGAQTVALLSHESPKSAVAEAYRSLRTSLSFSSAEGTPKLLHFTSAAAGEGKTTTALSTAIAVTQIGKQVLLIDADLRNPSLHKELRVSNESGLTNYLAGDYTPAQIVQKTRIKGLWSICTGPMPPNPAELLSSGKMVELLDQAEQRFDLVVVDSPPVLGLADSLILANMSRATVLVVDAGVTRQGSIRGAIKRLRGAQANLLGAVLTKYGQGGSGYGYDYEYSYNYYNYAGGELEGGPKQLAT